MPASLPVPPGSAEEVDEPGVVDGEQRVVVVRLGVDDRRAGVLERRADAVGARGQLVGVDRDADPDSRLRARGRRCASLHVTGIESATCYPAKRYSAATSGVRYAADGLPAGVKRPMIVSSRSALAFSTMCTSRGRSRNAEPGAELLGRLAEVQAARPVRHPDDLVVQVVVPRRSSRRDEARRTASRASSRSRRRRGSGTSGRRSPAAQRRRRARPSARADPSARGGRRRSRRS